MRFQRSNFGSFSSARVAAMAVLLVTACPAQAQVSYTSTTGAAYQQSFDSLLQTGSATFQQNAATDTTNGLQGWYAHRFTTVAATPTLTPSTGSSSGGNLYSFGATNNSDRALGSVGSNGEGSFVWAVRIQNNTGLDITGFTIGYTGEQWRFGGGAAPVTQTVEFSYGVFARNNELTGATLSNPAAAGFSDPGDMDFASPITSGNFTLDGNAAANRVVKSTNISATIPAGQELWVRWNDDNHDGNDHGMATDNFSFAATQFQPVPAPPAAVSLGIGSAMLILAGRLRHWSARRKRARRQVSGGGAAS